MHVMVDLGDPDWRRRVAEADGPVIAVGGTREEGLAALVAGADDWLPRADEPAVAEAVAKAQARRCGGEPDEVRLRRRTVSRVSRVVAHEINNSLSAILMYDGLLLERLGESDPGREAAEGVSEATRRAASLVRVLLACDRPGPARSRAVDLGRLVRERAPVLRLVLGSEGRVEVDLEADLPPVRADAARLEEVLLGVAVAVEARDFTVAGCRLPEGGVRLALDWEGPPLAPRDLRSLRQRLEEMDGRLGAGPGFEVLLPPVACGVLPADPVTDE